MSTDDSALKEAVAEIFNEECWHFTPEQDAKEVERLKRVVEDAYWSERTYCDSQPERLPDREWEVVQPMTFEFVHRVEAKTADEAVTKAVEWFRGLPERQRVSALGATLILDDDGDGGTFGTPLVTEARI